MKTVVRSTNVKHQRVALHSDQLFGAEVGCKRRSPHKVCPCSSIRKRGFRWLFVPSIRIILLANILEWSVPPSRSIKATTHGLPESSLCTGMTNEAFPAPMRESSSRCFQSRVSVRFIMSRSCRAPTECGSARFSKMTYHDFVATRFRLSISPLIEACA